MHRDTCNFAKWIGMKTNLWLLSLFPYPQPVVQAKWWENSQCSSMLIWKLLQPIRHGYLKAWKGNVRARKIEYSLFYSVLHTSVPLNEHGKVTPHKVKLWLHSIGKSHG